MSKAAILKGITVTLYEKTQAGTDGFNRPIYTEDPVQVENVLIGQPDTEEVLDTLELTGKKIVYTLGIPKGDTHVWTDRKVGFFGDTFHVISEPEQGIESMIPLDWNKKVKVERYGG